MTLKAPEIFSATAINAPEGIIFSFILREEIIQTHQRWLQVRVFTSSLGYSHLNYIRTFSNKAGFAIINHEHARTPTPGIDSYVDVEWYYEDSPDGQQSEKVRKTIKIKSE